MEDENKIEICAKLCELLKLTQAGRGIERIWYDEARQCAVIYRGGYTHSVNVGGDSGIALIKDIIGKV